MATDLLTLEQAAERLSVSVDAVRDLEDTP